MRKKIQSFLIAGGNPTLLIRESNASEKKKIIKKYLGEYDQIGFIEEGDIPVLSMMGSELCINATIAFASTLSRKGYLKTSGVEDKIFYENRNNQTFLQIKLPYRKIKNCVLFNGIGYICKNELVDPSKNELLSYVKKYNLPAFGELQYIQDKIRPFVYVSETDSLIPDSACGSGSLALNVYKNVEKVIQPTGQIIFVRRKKDTFWISAFVEKLK